MPAGEVPAAGRNGRYAWLDHARGIGIILVVYGHQLRAQAAIGQVPASWHGPFQDGVIYSFHMPLFFFLSGIVALKSLRTRPFGESLIDKLKSIAYPYFLWSIVSWCLSALAAAHVNRPMGVDSLLSILYQPILQYWFLYILFFCQLLVLLVRRVFVANVVIAAILLVAPLPFVSPTVNEFVASFPFFVIGMVMAGPLLAPAGRREALVAASVLAAFVALASVRFGGGGAASGVFVQACPGIPAVILVARVVGARWSWLAALGRGSMAIFVLHTIVAAAIRTVMGLFGIPDPLAMFAICIAGGLIVPLAILRVAARYRLEAWLGLGKADRPAARADRPMALAVP